MRYTNLKKAIISTVIGAFVLVGTALIGAAQQTNSREYRDWQKARQDAEMREQSYNRSHNNRDYERWQKAQKLVQQRQLAYQQYMNRYNYGYNNSYNNGYNNGYKNGSRAMWRVYTNGSYYDVDDRQAALLRQAVNNGYAQGYQQGAIAKRRGYAYNYNRESMYMSGTYGYQSYVARNQYQYYFQQGFQRGYEDGYYNTSRYGYRSGNTFSLIGSVVDSIINLTRQ